MTSKEKANIAKEKLLKMKPDIEARLLELCKQENEEAIMTVAQLYTSHSLEDEELIKFVFDYSLNGLNIVGRMYCGMAIMRESTTYPFDKVYKYSVPAPNDFEIPKLNFEVKGM